jgi:hypothetical protein
MESINKDKMIVDESRTNLRKISLDEAIDDIVGDNFSPDKDYFEALETAKKIDDRQVFLPYGYRCLGDYFIDKENYAKAAQCYSIGLTLYPNPETISHLIRRGARDIDEQSLFDFFNSPAFRGPASLSQ